MKNVIISNEDNSHRKKSKESSNHIFPDINEVVKEKNKDLELIEKKKEVSSYFLFLFYFKKIEIKFIIIFY